MGVEDESVTAEDNDESIKGQEFDADLVAGKFSEAMRAYTEMILKHHSENKQDPATNRAMMAMTRTIKRSLKCALSTHHNQMNTFGKSTVAVGRQKGAVIKVNPPAAASRKFKVPGRAPALLGRLLKDRSGKVQLLVTEDGDFVSKSAKAISVPKKRHNLNI